ncbi:MAG: Crp/Fnr family transcriptional regulator, partial [Deltaproteobacteria bacterium]|nr:Crp/Fnr family transcriptional regulator [Deltaproteobacteria bacterium]
TEGDFFGDGCLVTRGPREEMTEAMEPSSSVEVPWESLLALVDSNPKVASFLARVTLIRQRDLESKFEQLIFKDVGAKLAELLLELGTRHGVVSQSGLELALKITHQELANLIGSTRETVSLTLSQFKRKGYITTEGRRVILADQDGLRSLG